MLIDILRFVLNLVTPVLSPVVQLVTEVNAFVLTVWAVVVPYLSSGADICKYFLPNWCILFLLPSTLLAETTLFTLGVALSVLKFVKQHIPIA